ncbi:MAG: outer membrane lipoprotein-sorting protein [Pseudomonadales bacterium]|jgi:hypothetical protein|nr:outer membrane lipoprotein-sorting protein [Pseudomonadales bacterium]MDP7593988.1 outer membrane lipoprotein-sorting protein [Pseudomonadales bacterium]HJN48856.1 outer membrane lipoprotein-sorting protein [Pseudomonadales bacterium]|tara:strand:+ start:2889 stop:3698 length:810 start_codon:yes stop_codon:yes gene_type:complete
MKLYTWTLTLLLVVANGHAKENLFALEIMQAVKNRDEGDQVTQIMEMILIDRRGNQRKRTLSTIRKDVGEDTYSILFFTEPADVRDTAFLTWDYDAYDRDDDQWLYLPALRKTKRIASRDKSGSFMGSDFSYADMTARPLERYQFNIMKETLVNERSVWQIETLPNEEEVARTGYRRSILFVRQDNFVVVRAVHWQAKGGITKYLDVKELQQLDGIWVTTQVQMTSRKGKEVRHRTILYNRDTRFNQPMQDEWFSMRQLEKGPPAEMWQ